MTKYFLILVACIIGSGSVASTMTSLQLTMNLDSMGFSQVSIYGEDYYADEEENLISYHDYLDVADDTWGITKHFDRFAVDQAVTLVAEIYADRWLSTCSIGGYSCRGSRASVNGFEFGIADGSGRTSWGDFGLMGGLRVGDAVTMYTFHGGYHYEIRPGQGYVQWDIFHHKFTVTAASISPAPVPLPASALFLVAGVFGLGVLKRAKKPAH